MKRFDWIQFWADITPDKVAAIHASSQDSVTYHELNDRGERLAYYLQKELGFKKGDRVIVVAQNCLEYLYLFAAAQKIGLCIVPLNYRLTAHELSSLIVESEAKLVLYHQDFSRLIEKEEGAQELHGFFERVLNSANQGILSPVDIHEDDPIFILFTSGSSGFPKGVLYTHKMLFWNSVNTQISLVINNETKTVVCLPPFHTGAWNVLLTPLLHVGGSVVLMEKFDASSVLTNIEKHRCQIFMGVPTMLQMMRDDDAFDKIDLSHLKYIIVGGEAMSLSLIEDYHAKGVPIRQGYGMTEVGPNLTSLHESNAISKIGSIGKPNMYVQCKILKEDGTEAKPLESGELCLKGPMLTPGYFNASSIGSEAFGADGWFRTGDIVMKDEDGFLYIVDRKKNMYISGGENVYPAEIERKLKEESSIQDLVIVAVPDKQWGEVGYAFVVSSNLDKDGVLAICRQRISKYKSPKHIEILEALPKTDTGKIDRLALKNKALNRLA